MSVGGGEITRILDTSGQRSRRTNYARKVILTIVSWCFPFSIPWSQLCSAVLGRWINSKERLGHIRTPSFFWYGFSQFLLLVAVEASYWLKNLEPMVTFRPSRAH